VLLLAAALRATGLGWGLRHVPHVDERYFVESAAWMIRHGDVDHRFHEYPAVVVYVIAPVLCLARDPFGPEAYLLARGVVATFGVLSVFLVFLLGSRLAGTGAGLAAAALLAVSPVEVHTAHTLRPDVVLESFALLAFLAFAQVGGKARDDAASGLAVGAATAVKFSGVLLAPCYLIQRLLSAGPRPERLVLAGGVAAVAFAAFSPHSILEAPLLLEGIRIQLGYHYAPRPRGEQSYWGLVDTYLRSVLPRALGWIGLALAAYGAFAWRREWRRWLALAAFPAVTIAVFSTAEVHHDRFLVPSLGAVAVFAGVGVRALHERARPGLAWGVTALALALPLSSSLEFLRAVARPGTRDRALDWIEARLPRGARIVTSVRDLGLDRRRFEVLEIRRLEGASRLAALHADAVVSGPEDEPDEVRRFAALFAAEPGHPQEGPAIRILEPGPLRPRYEAFPLARARLAASENPELLPLLHDGDEATAWATAGPQTPGSWIEVAFPSPVVVGRVELGLGARPLRFGENLHVLVREGARSEWRRAKALAGRPPVAQQVGGRPSQILLLEPARVAALRVVQRGRRARPWAIAELGVDVLPAR
jgi:hypothetical protein